MHDHSPAKSASLSQSAKFSHLLPFAIEISLHDEASAADSLIGSLAAWYLPYHSANRGGQSVGQFVPR